jgi:hypothetical protein
MVVGCKGGNAQGLYDVFGLEGNALGVVKIRGDGCGWGGLVLTEMQDTMDISFDWTCSGISTDAMHEDFSFCAILLCYECE